MQAAVVRINAFKPWLSSSQKGSAEGNYGTLLDPFANLIELELSEDLTIPKYSAI